MTHDDIIRMAREAGFDAESDTLTRYEGFVKPLTRFATLVVANLDPKSFMSWQEGYEGGLVAEREACAKVCDQYDVAEDVNTCDTAEGIALAIRARGQA
jgi:hypothetical protein